MAVLSHFVLQLKPSSAIAAGGVNPGTAFALGAPWPAWTATLGAMLVGFFAYGVSLALFVIALRHLDTARTGAYFSVAPFFGAVLALLMGESLTVLIYPPRLSPISPRFACDRPVDTRPATPAVSAASTK